MRSFAGRSLVSLAAVALVLGSSTALAMHGQPPTNRFGLPTVSADGARIVYTQAELAGRTPVPATAPTSPHTPAEVPVLPVAWDFPLFGSGIGASGILVLPTADGPPEIVVGGNSASNFGADDFWQVLQFDGNGYHSVFCSEMYSSKIVKLLAGHPASAGNKEIVVILEDGTVLRFDASTRAAVGSFTLPFAPTSARLHDLDGDGIDELVVAGASSLGVFDASGTQLWSVAEGGNDVEVGQMDSDPALEIALTSGVVIDSGTHQIQWSYAAGFGNELRCHDIDGDGMDELIAAHSWYFVWAFDVDVQLPKWSIPTALDISAIEVADVTGDGTSELLISDLQLGTIHAIDMATKTELWAIPSSESGATNIAVGDFDQDGVIELAWGGGWYDTGPDNLFVASAATRQIEWQNVELDGPFIGPEVGDVDGDGVDEIVVGVPSTDSTYGGGRILVFDGQTHELLAMGPPAPITKNLLDLKLRNVDDDPALEIVAAWDQLYHGVAEIFDFDRAGGQLVSQWTNAVQPDGVGFTSVDAGDLDGDGAVEVIAGGRRDHTGGLGVFTYVYDYATGTEEWHTSQLGSYWASVARAAMVGGGVGSADLVACVDGGSIYVFDGATGSSRQTIEGAFKGFILSSDAGSRTLYAWDAAGNVTEYRKTTGDYELGPTTATSPASYGLTPSGGLWLVGAGSRLSLQDSLSSAPIWTTPTLGPSFGRRAAIGPQGYLYSAGNLGLFAFATVTVQGVTPTSGPAAAGQVRTVLASPLEDGVSCLVGGVPATVTGSSGDELDILTPELSPGTLNDIEVSNPDGTFGILRRAYLADFTDVQRSHALHRFVESIFRAGVTAGCGDGLYCVDQGVTRAQMAIFLLTSHHGDALILAPPTGTVFSDVPADAFAAAFIERLAADGITAGCGGGNFCPGQLVTRAQMAVFLLSTLEGSSYTPPPAVGMFSDVPPDNPFAPWIEELARRGITAGCGGGKYCPEQPVTRGQMAVFLTTTFSLP